MEAPTACLGRPSLIDLKNGWHGKSGCRARPIGRLVVIEATGPIDHSQAARHRSNRYGTRHWRRRAGRRLAAAPAIHQASTATERLQRSAISKLPIAEKLQVTNTHDIEALKKV